MKYIKLLEHFDDRTPKQDLMGKLLHLYGPIPISKQISQIVIKKILFRNYYKLGEPVNLEYHGDHDKVRFVDYFDTLLKYKETRGHNFEGFIAGIYNGELSKPGEKYDVTIDGKTWSVKFVDSPSKAPELGSYRNPLKSSNLFDIVEKSGGLTNIFQSRNVTLKNEIWTKVISKDITGGWLIAYEIEDGHKILVNTVELDEMKSVLLNGGTAAPKGGFKSLFTLALSADGKKSNCYRNNSKKFEITIPELTFDELKKITIFVMFRMM
jgi:hypothetical protein